jgi:hypothetical protein
MKTISFKVLESVDRKLAAAAKQRQTSKSAVVREALELFLSDGSRPPRKRGSFAELAKRWIGPGSGLGDLSYNEKYMEGFGK